MSEAAEVSRYYFFKTWFLKLKYPNLRISEPPLNKFYLAFFDLSDPNYLWHFIMRYPVICNLLSMYVCDLIYLKWWLHTIEGVAPCIDFLDVSFSWTLLNTTEFVYILFWHLICRLQTSVSLQRPVKYSDKTSK
jgi:hypothetical protein